MFNYKIITSKIEQQFLQNRHKDRYWKFLYNLISKFKDIINDLLFCFEESEKLMPHENQLANYNWIFIMELKIPLFHYRNDKKIIFSRISAHSYLNVEYIRDN